MTIPADLPFAGKQAIDLLPHQVRCAAGAIGNALITQTPHPLSEVPSKVDIAGLLCDGLRQQIDERNARIGPIGHPQAFHDGFAVDGLKNGSRVDGQRVASIFTHNRERVVLWALGGERHSAKRGMEKGRDGFFIVNAQKGVHREL